MENKISIITIVKNGLPHIKSSIKSFNLQNYPNKELIIVYGDSKDGTEKYLESIKQNNITIIKDDQSNNRYAAINIGIKKLTGDIFGILHSDDIFYSENTLSLISKNMGGDVDCLYGNIMFSQKNNILKINRVWKSKKFKRGSLKYGWTPPHTSIFLKNNLKDKFLYDEKYFISSDYFFILKIFNSQNLKIKYLNEFITIMRLGGDSTKLKNFYIKFSEDLEVSKKFFKLYYLTVILKIIRKIFQIKLIKKNMNNEYIKKLII
mgnify:CR=1 FL=1